MHYHFIGIKGIGMSALASYFRSKGIFVTGSDLGLGGHCAKNISKDIDLVIYSLAIKKDNPEIKRAKELKIPCISYAQALGKLTKEKFTIAVSGMHGKSTTASLISLILDKAGLNPTVIVGTKIKEFNYSNFAVGGRPDFRKVNLSNKLKSEISSNGILVIEADEYCSSFLNYWPRILVLLNLEREHLDYFRNLSHIKRIFLEYISHLKKDDFLVVNKEDRNLKEIVKSAKCRVIFFSGKNFRDINPKFRELRDDFSAALKVSEILKIPKEISERAIKNFNGVWRRFDLRTIINGAEIYDDYAHHPTEIKLTLSMAKRITKNSLWVVFQPHQYKRTYLLFKDFVKSFDKADKLILVPIFSVPGRESLNIKRKINSEKLADNILRRWKRLKYKKEIFFMDIKEVHKFLYKNLNKGDLCILMGAGDIYEKIQISYPQNE
ncbi:UDP-N-acetylmuramate--L-alanine ligase [bacterium]|nr:UDP-N-acetylmuramate--L-alanine ligase [bacterium]